MQSQEQVFNSYTDGNPVIATNAANIGHFSAPDSSPGGNAYQMNNTAQQQGGGMYRMPPDPTRGRAANTSRPRPVQAQGKQGDCNCK